MYLKQVGYIFSIEVEACPSKGHGVVVWAGIWLRSVFPRPFAVFPRRVVAFQACQIDRCKSRLLAKKNACAGCSTVIALVVVAVVVAAMVVIGGPRHAFVSAPCA